MNQRIALVTDAENGDSEDAVIADYLGSNGLAVSAFHFREVADDDWGNFDCILLRDIWPHHSKDSSEYQRFKTNFLAHAKARHLPVYNSVDASGDMRGKAYLVELYQKGFPVIPTIFWNEDLSRLPESNLYIIKPTNGFSSLGIQETTREMFNREEKPNDTDFILQPKITFVSEVSFYFIDRQFVYCLEFSPSKIPVWPNPEPVQPSAAELEMAHKFVEWNKLRYGVQRVDFLRLPDGSLLLLEIEDFTPYMSLTEIKQEDREQFLLLLIQSIRRFLAERTS